jgi:diaminopimelate epimerase
MVMFNADGSEAQICGNGLRCLVKYAADRGLVGNKEKVTIETIAGLRQAKVTRQKGIVSNIQVGMGKPEFEAAKIPVAVEGRELRLSFVGMGNPHAVYFQQQPPAEFPLANIGPIVEKHKLFPKRVNFEVARVISRKLIEMRVWERGVGETLACGSGACAVAVAAQLLGYADNPVSIKLPGGTLRTEWSRGGEVLLSSAAEIVFDGELPD